MPFACSLIASDGKRGLLYIGNDNKLTILKCNAEEDKNWKHEHHLSQQIARISLSCDNTYLGVTFSRSTAQIFNANSLTKNNLELLHEIQLSSFNQNVFGYDLRWNPAIPGMFCTIASDHCIGSFAIKVEQKATVGVVAMENIPNIDAMCVSWSPKGKQLVVGCKNGNIVQLKPELKVARTILGPSPHIGEIIAILWITNYQFCAAYADKSKSQISILIVDAPKGEQQGIFTCYDDITYGSPDTTNGWFPRYYFEFLPEWNLIIVASSDSAEVAALGSEDNGVNWMQWFLDEAGRAALPLIRDIEAFPLGLTIDKTPTIIMPWGDDNLPHPMPVLHIFGTSGQLIGFHIINVRQNSPPLCSPPTEPVAIAPQQAKMNLLPSEISFNINSNATSTPRAKQEVQINKPKTLQATNLFADVQKTLPAAAPPQPVAAPIQQVQLPPAPVPTIKLKIPNPRVEKTGGIGGENEWIKLNVPPVKEVSTPSRILNKPDVDKLCLRAFQEEQVNFEKELKSKLQNISIECGTEGERKYLGAQSADIDGFLRELKEVTAGQAIDIAYLKGLLLQSFAWVEEIKSRNSDDSIDNTHDRHDRSKVKELQRLFCQTQSQLIQTVKALDMEWLEYESREKEKLRIPNLEFIYQSLKKQSEIITREKSIIEAQSKKWKTLSRGNVVSSLNQSLSKLNLSRNSSFNGETGMIKARCQTIANNNKNFNYDKQIKLRQLLMQTKPRIIKAVNPSPVQDRLEKTLSSLATSSPLAPTPKPLKISSHHSSLLPELQKINTTSTAFNQQQSSITNQQSTLIPNTIKLNLNTGNLSTNIGNMTPNTVKSNPNTFKSPPSSSAAPPVQKSTGQSPLASLNSIVSKIGSTSSTNSAQSPPSINTTKPILFHVKNLSHSSSIPPIQTPTSTAFSKSLTVSFGHSEPPKQPDNFGNPISKDTTQKTELSFGTKDSGTAQNSSTNLFSSENLFKTSLPSGMTITKLDKPSTTQSQSQSVLATALSSTVKESTPSTTKSNNFSFANPPQSTVTTKPSITKTETPVSTLPNFSSAAKPTSDPPSFPFASNPTSAAAPPPLTNQSQALNLSGLSMGFGDNKTVAASQPQSLTITATTTTTTTATSTLGKPTTSTVNFGKLPPVLSSQQSKPSVVSLPPGTSIAKVSNTPPVLSPALSSPFASTTPTMGIFGAATSGSPSIFGGASPATGTATSSSSPFGGTPTVAKSTNAPTSTTSSIFGAPAPAFPQSTAASTPATNTAFSSSGFGEMMNNSMSGLNFGNPPSAATNTPAPSAGIFGGGTQTNNTGSIFGGMSVVAPSTGIFGVTSSTPQSNSIFGGSAAPASPFGASSTGSIFGGGGQKPAANVFGGNSAFGASPAIQASSPGTNSTFGSSAAFGTNSVFGASAFGGAKPEFGSSPAFGASPSFGAQPVMGSSSPMGGTTAMGVFGNAGGGEGGGGGSIFGGNSGGQNGGGGLSFGSLAQKSPEKPPEFSGGSSFSSWR